MDFRPHILFEVAHNSMPDSAVSVNAKEKRLINNHVPYGTIRCGMIRNGMKRYGKIRCFMIRNGIIRYGLTRTWSGTSAAQEPKTHASYIRVAKPYQTMSSRTVLKIPTGEAGLPTGEAGLLL